jgi:hypothetical protein
MFKIFVALLLVVCLGGSARGQGLSNFFSQGSAKVEYYAEQLAGLQLYISKIEKAAQIVGNGLQDIKEIKNGEFNLHQAFFGSLSQVNPAVAKMELVGEIIALQVAIIEQYSAALKRWRSGATLTPGELGYAGQVYSTISQLALEDVNELITLTAADNYLMTDDQRISRITALDQGVKDQYGFVQSYMSQMDLMAMQRQQEQSDQRSLDELYGLP